MIICPLIKHTFNCFLIIYSYIFMLILYPHPPPPQKSKLIWKQFCKVRVGRWYDSEVRRLSTNDQCNLFFSLWKWITSPEKKLLQFRQDGLLSRGTSSQKWWPSFGLWDRHFSGRRPLTLLIYSHFWPRHAFIIRCVPLHIHTHHKYIF